MEVELLGPIGDPSGYGHDCRQVAHALIRAGVDLSINRIGFDKFGFTCNYGRIESVLRPHIRKPKAPKVQIVESTPEFWPKLVRDDCYTIGRLYWETDRVHPKWPEYIRESGVQELWLPNQFHIDVLRKDLDMKMTCIPAPHDVEIFDATVAPMNFISDDVTEDTFVFGAGFQWTPRKNPTGLITAYIAEFQPDEPVALVLKTYGTDTSQEETDRIQGLIDQACVDTGIDPYPPVLMLSKLLSFEEMLQWRKRTDCGVYPHRGEGWGLHISETMLMETPCIVTNWSGSTEFCNEENSYLLDYHMTPVRNMWWCPWYRSTQSWAEPDLMHLRRLMRHTFEHRKSSELSDKGIAARATIYARYNLDAVGALMAKRLQEIVEV